MKEILSELWEDTKLSSRIIKVLLVAYGIGVIILMIHNIQGWMIINGYK
jgi:hypothetical protein